MPSALPLELLLWKRPAKTKANLDWADISVIDISSFDEPGGKERLANELRNAVGSLIAVVVYTNKRTRFKRRVSLASLARVSRKRGLKDSLVSDKNFSSVQLKRRIGQVWDVILGKGIILGIVQ